MADQVTRHWRIGILWALSLVVTAAASSFAQRAPRPLNLPVLTTPTVVSGNDVGFRIERTVDGIQVGKLVVRVSGVWVDTDAPAAAGR